MKAPHLSESDVQRAIVDYLRAVLCHCVVAAVPNASRRTKTGKASNAVAGLLPGFPDLQIIGRDGRVFLIEVKNATGRLSAAQDDLLAKFIELGVPYAVCRSIDEARGAIRNWGLPIRETFASAGQTEVA